MITGKTPFILNQAPDLVVREYAAKSNHTGPRHPVLDHPKDLSFRPMPPKSHVPEIPWRGIQPHGRGAVARSSHAMAVETRGLALI
jgi:hypothetical protein